MADTKPQPQSQLTGSLGGVQKAFEELGSTIKENVLSPTQILNKEFISLGDTLKTLVIAAAGPTAAILVFGEALGGLVNKANPAVFQQFTLAVNDLMAVIGRALVPLFETVVIPVIRMAADSLMDLAPAGAALAAALQPLVELIGGAFGVAVGILAEAIKFVSPLIMVFARVLNDVGKIVGNAVRELLALIGISLPAFGGKPGASVGAATRQAGHSGIDDVVKQAQRAAFSLGNAQNDPMGKMANAMDGVKSRADEIYKRLEDMIAHIDELPAAIGEFILKLPIELAKLLFPETVGGLKPNANKYQEKYGVGFGEAVGEAAKQFWRDVKTDTWAGRQATKPGVLGFTSFNPFG